LVVLKIDVFTRLMAFVLFFAAGEVMAQATFESAGDGDWDNNGSWSLVSGIDVDGVPDAGDNVTILTTHTIDLDNGTDAACFNLTMVGTAEIRITEANLTLTVNGTMTMNGTSRVEAGASGIRLLNLLGNFIIPTGQTATFDNVDITQAASQTFTVLGELISSSATGDKAVGNVLINSGGTSTGKWTFTSVETWDVQSLTMYDGPVGQSLIGGTSTGTINVLGNFSVVATTGGQRSRIGRCNLTVTGTTNVAGGVLFTVSALGDKRFNNTITITPTGTWDNEIVETPFINCSIVNNGTWPLASSGTPAYTVETTGSFTYTGSSTIYLHRLVITQATVANMAPLTLNGAPDQGLQVDNAATFINGNGGYLTLLSTLDNLISIGGGTGTIDVSAVANTVEYGLAGAQNVFPTTYHKLVCSNSGTKTQATGTVTVNSELDITGAAIYNVGTNTLGGAANLVMTGTSELRLAKTAVNLPELTGTSNSLASGTTINLTGNAAQTLKASSTYAYQNVSVSGTAGSAANLSNVTTILGNLSVTNAGTVSTIPAGGLTVAGTYSTNSTGTTFMTAGNLTVGSIVLAGSGTLNYSGRTITVNGNNGAWTNNGIGTLTTNASSLVQFTTGTGQQLGGSTATTFQHLTINNSNGVTLNTVNPTVSGTLTLTTGALMTGANRVIAPTVTRTSGFVEGNLQKPVSIGTGISVLYETGSGITYAPVTLVFASVSVAGTGFVAGTTAGDHPEILSSNIEPSFSVNRYYSLMSIGVTFTTLSAIFDFGSGDVDAGFSPAVDAGIKRYDGTGWTSTAIGTRTATSTQFINSAAANFPNNTSRDYQIGRVITIAGFFNRETGTRDWHLAATWINNRTGTISLVNGSNLVHGTGTEFTTQLVAGDQLVLQSAPGATPITILSITDDDDLVLNANYGGANTSGGYGRLKVPNSSADSVVVGNSNLADATTTIELTANATVHTLIINGAPTTGRTTSHNVTHTGTSQLTAGRVVVNQPSNAVGTVTDAWNINGGSAIVTGNVTIGSANNNANRIATVVLTTGSPTLTIGGDLFFNTATAIGAQVSSVLNVGSGRINLAGSITYSASQRGTLTMGAAGIFNFAGTTASQSIDLPSNNPASFVFSNIECNNTSTNGVQLIEDVGTANLTGNVRVLTGKLQMVNSGTPILTGTATRTLEIANGTTLEMLGNGSQVFPTGFTTYTLGNSSTVVYGQTGNMNLATATLSYGNLTFSGSPNYTFPNNTFTINGTLTIGNGTSTPDVRGTTATTLNVTGDVVIAANGALTATNIGTLTLQGNWTNNGTFTAGAGTTSVVFGGNGASQPQTIGGTTADSFFRLRLNTNDDTDIVRLSKNITVTNLLTLTRGGLELNGNQISITSNATTAITRASPGYIKSETTGTPHSRVRWTISTGTGSYVYPFGKTSAAADYVPFTLNVTGAGVGTGTFEVSTYATAGDNTPYPSGVTNVTSGLDNSGSQVTDRFWILTPAGFTTSPTSTLTFTTTSTEAAGIGGNLRAQRWTTGNVWESPLPSQSNPTSTSVSVPGVTTYSPWTLASHLTPLPIELLKFEARPANGAIDLSWETATEINNEYFDVERSRVGEEFTPIGRISGAGNSHSVHRYNFTDTYPLAGNAYYRLRQTDYDGKLSYSWVLRVETAASFTILAWPNPSDGRELNINWRDGEPGGTIAVRLWTQTGAQAFEGQFTLDENLNSRVSFDERLSVGLYVLEVQTTNGVQRLKVVVK
jgi:hypothetical protein